jgi:threonylcarbamoyladenosine tRNA methylthiotransferase MtaB
VKVSLVTLGCKVSQYDGAKLEGVIEKAGGEPVPPSPQSQAFIICGCAVTEKAVKEASQIIRRFKRMNPQAPVLLYGCLGELGSRQGLENCFPPGDQEGVLKALGLTNGEKTSTINWHRTRGVVKIQDGCDRFCAFCIVPHLRGKPKSRDLEEIREEVSSLARAGFKEVVLTGVHLSSFGRDLGGENHLIHLLKEINETPGIERIRLSSLEPVDLHPQGLSNLKEITRLCPHFHLPLQSGSDRILKSMNRGYTFSHFLSLVETIKATWPEASITTDIMVGFPGEEEEDFDLTLEAVERVEFLKVHAFRYSPRPFTPAQNFPGQVDEETKRKRLRRLMDLSSRVSLKFKERFRGHVLQVLIEKQISPFEGVGFSSNYIKVKVKSGKPLTCNTIVPVRILSVADYCLGEAL